MGQNICRSKKSYAIPGEIAAVHQPQGRKEYCFNFSLDWNDAWLNVTMTSFH